MATYQTKPRKQRQLKEHITTLHYDYNNASTTLLQHRKAVTMPEAEIDLFLKMGGKASIFKLTFSNAISSFLKFRQKV